MIIIGLYFRIQHNKESIKTVVDARPVHTTGKSMSYISPSDMFACRLSAMWVEKNFLNHHFIKCFEEKDSDGIEKSIKLLKDQFNIKNQEDFSRQLYFFQDNASIKPLKDFVANIQALIKSYEGNEQSIAQGIMASYEKASYITQYYNCLLYTSPSPRD